MEDIQDAPSQIIINGQEYAPDEASTLIEKGRMASEYEQKWNTSLDKVWPEYGRSREELKQAKDELAEAKVQLTEYTSKLKEGTETNQDIAQAKESARKLGLLLNEDLDKAGYIKKSDLDSYYDTKRQEEQAVKQVLEEADRLEKDLNGSDGRPKFNKRAVMAYASAYGFNDLTAAYEDMNQDALAPWKEAQIAAQKAKSLKTLSGGGAKSPSTPKIGDDNFKAALHETLWGAKEE